MIVLNDYFLRNSTARIIGVSYDQGVVAIHFWKWNLTFRRADNGEGKHG